MWKGSGNGFHSLGAPDSGKSARASEIEAQFPGRCGARTEVLSVGRRTIGEWLSRIDKDAKEARNKRIFAAWLACHTQEEIGEREGVSHPAVNAILSEMADLPKLTKPEQAACHTQEEIAEREGLSVQPVKDAISDFSASLPKNLEAAALSEFGNLARNRQINSGARP